MGAIVVPIDIIKPNEKFDRWVRQVLEFNERSAPLSENEVVFLKNRFNQGKQTTDVVI